MGYLYATRHIDIKVVSKEENLKASQQLNSERPISPNFNIYKWPLAGLASGAQRATGFALILGIMQYIEHIAYSQPFDIMINRLDHSGLVIITWFTNHCVANIH